MSGPGTCHHQHLGRKDAEPKNHDHDGQQPFPTIHHLYPDPCAHTHVVTSGAAVALILMGKWRGSLRLSFVGTQWGRHPPVLRTGCIHINDIAESAAVAIETQSQYRRSDDSA